MDDIKVDVIQDARLRIELAVSYNLAAEMFNVSKNQVRRLSKKGIDTPSSKDGRPKAATKEILEDAANIIQAHALSDDVLSKKQCHELLRDLFAGLGTSRLNKIKTGVPIASAGVLSKKTVERYLKQICPESLGFPTSHDKRRKETMFDPYAMLSLTAGVEGAMLPVLDRDSPHTLRPVEPWNLVNSDISSIELQKKGKGREVELTVELTYYDDDEFIGAEDEEDLDSMPSLILVSD